MYTDGTWQVDWGCILDAPRGYFIKVLTNSITTYPGGNLVGLWGVLCECTYWVLVGVNYVYIIKDIRPHPSGLCGANWRVNCKSDPHGPGGFVLGTLFQNSP